MLLGWEQEFHTSQSINHHLNTGCRLVRALSTTAQGGESSLSSFPGFSCCLQDGVRPAGSPPGLEGSPERACGAGHQLTARALPRGAAVSRDTLQGVHPSGSGMKAPVPSLCGGSVGGRVRRGGWVLGEPCLAPGSVAGGCQQRSNQTCTFC